MISSNFTLWPGGHLDESALPIGIQCARPKPSLHGGEPELQEQSKGAIAQKPSASESDLAEALPFAAEGKVKGHIYRAALEDVGDVFRALKSGQVDGRMVLDMALLQATGLLRPDCRKRACPDSK